MWICLQTMDMLFGPVKLHKLFKNNIIDYLKKIVKLLNSKWNLVKNNKKNIIEIVVPVNQKYKTKSSACLAIR